MAYVIAAPCIDHQDQACIDSCPVDCITFEPGLDRKAYIDPDGCIECGACVNECPQGAIYHETELPGPWAVFARIDRAWYRDSDMARDAVDAAAAAAA
ncbi:MAG: 4Fe-4S binding protein [Chloroflexi bacterium]|nr:4Fe-4S binding protein [Chloroflexota bacterium]